MLTTRIYQSSEDGITVSDISTNSDSGLKQHSPYSSDENATPTPTNQKPRRKPRKFSWKFSKKIKSNTTPPAVPPRQPIMSTMYSTSSSMTSLSQVTQQAEYLELFLPIASYGSLGIMVVGQTTKDGQSLGIYCGGVQPNSAAFSVREFIEPGDRIVSVDQLDITKLTNDQAVAVLQERVDICLKRIHGRHGFKIGISKFSDDLEEEYDEVETSKRENVQAINPAEWVKNHTSFYEGRSYWSCFVKI